MNHRNGQHDDSRFEEPSEDRPTDDVRPRKRRHNGVNGRHAAKPNDKASDDQAARKPRSLSEISHLFLSDLRNAAGQGRTPPKRIPPGHPRDETPPRPNPDLELHIDDLEDCAAADAAGNDDELDCSTPPLSAVIGARLGGLLVRRACQYAAGLADELPVGLLIVEPECMRLIWVSQGDWDEPAEDAPEMLIDANRVRAALLEMSCDIARWLVVLPDPRLPQARRMLSAIREWVLLTPADHEGVVASYRVLKGLCDLELPDEHTEAPHVTLAFVDADDAAEAQRHARKLIGVCKQFLDLQIEPADLSAPAAGAVSSIGHFIAREVATAAWNPGAAAHGGTSIAEQVLLRATPAQAPEAETESLQETTMAQEQPTHSAARAPRQDSLASKFPDNAIPAMARPAGAAGFFADDWALAGEEMVRLERRLDPRKPVSAQAISDNPPVRTHVDDFEIPELALPVADSARAAATPSAKARRGIIEPPVASFASSSAAAGVLADSASPMSDDVETPIDSSGVSTASATTHVVSAGADPGFPLEPHRSGLQTQHGPQTARAGRISPDDEVIDLPAGGTVADVVLARLGLAETAITPPMLPGAKLCISRLGAIVLVAAAAPGLGELPAVGRAMTWANENRTLLRMALSQFRIVDSADVLLHLLVSRADANAEALRPLMSTGRVTVQAYRPLTWGGRRGLLLEAA